MTEFHTLYGSPMSLYTGRARSYLIKAGIPYRELPHATPHFYEHVLPRAGGRRGIPTLELASGEVIRDGVAIVDHFERAHGQQFSPPTPRQHIVSLLFDAIAAEGLLRPCMHYRWNFDRDNDAALRFHFATIYMDHDDPQRMASERMALIRTQVNPAWGVVPETHALIEDMHHRLLRLLDAHFVAQPYLLGGKPSLGDFGLMAPLYGHLGRDPAPMALMQRLAPRVFRWVERMNRQGPDAGEYGASAPDYLEGDRIPATLIEVLRHLSLDYVPETLAAARYINAWLGAQENLAAGTEAVRGVGMCEFEVEGVSIRALAQPFRFFVLARVQKAFDNLSAQDKESVKEVLVACGLEPILTCRLDREMGRRDNLEVWL
ncbi:MAG: glutathione S-transferase N-terminal domain-containing protein [Pseudomonadota bacterium]